MKIALITPLTGAYSGAHEYAVQLKNCLQLEGHDVTIFSIAGLGKCPIEGVTKLYLGKMKNNVNVLKDFDVIHFTTVSENTKDKPRFLPYTTQFKYFVTIHSCERDLQSATGWQTVVANAKGIIFTSESNRQYYIVHYPELVREENSYVVNLPYLAKSMTTHEKQPLALCTSRFISYKKIREFLLAAKELPEITFVALSTIRTGEKSYVNGMITMAYLKDIMKKTEGLTNAMMSDYYDIQQYNKKSQEEIKAEFLTKAKYVVDLSSFEIDRDRVQYTTLEAMDYGCVPIFHTKFFGEILVPNKNGLVVVAPEYLGAVLKTAELVDLVREQIIASNFKFLKDRHGRENTLKFIDIYKLQGS